MKAKYFIIMIGVILFSSQLSSMPKLVFGSGKTYDFGTVKQKDSPLKTEISIYNKGTDTLIIKRVKPMCGCTTAPLSKKQIAPGDSAILKVTLNVEHYQGEIEKSISFVTNYMTDETFLTLKANVYQPIKVFPDKYINFAQMYIGTQAIGKLVIDNLSDHDIHVTSLTIEPPDIVVNIKQGDFIPKDSEFVITATVNPSTIGQFSSKITITTDEPNEPPITIVGYGRIDSASAKKMDTATNPNIFDAKAKSVNDSTVKNLPLLHPNAPATLNPAMVKPGNNGIQTLPPNPNMPRTKIQLAPNNNIQQLPTVDVKPQTELKEPPKPEVKEPPKPEIKELPKPEIKELPKPEIKELPKPEVKEPPKPPVKEEEKKK